MRFSVADIKKAKSRKRDAGGEAARPRAVAKRPRPVAAAPLSIREPEEDEVEEIPPPVPDVVPVAPPQIDPVGEGASTQTEAQRKGKAPMTSQDLEEENTYQVSFRVPQDATLINCKGLAEEVMKTVVLPQDWENRKNRPLEENVKSSYAGLAKLVVDLTVIQEGIAGFAAYSKDLQEKADSAKADADVAEELRKAGEAREARLQSELQTLRDQEKEKDARISALSEEIRTEKEKSNVLQGELDNSNSRRRSAEEKIGSLKDDLKLARYAVESAVAVFKSSEKYKEELAESGIDAFHLGFEDCKTKVTRAFPHLDLSTITESDDEGDGEEEGEGRAADQVIEAGETSAAPLSEDVPDTEVRNDGVGNVSLGDREGS